VLGLIVIAAVLRLLLVSRFIVVAILGFLLILLLRLRILLWFLLLLIARFLLGILQLVGNILILLFLFAPLVALALAFLFLLSLVPVLLLFILLLVLLRRLRGVLLLGKILVLFLLLLLLLLFGLVFLLLFLLLALRIEDLDLVGLAPPDLAVLVLFGVVAVVACLQPVFQLHPLLELENFLRRRLHLRQLHEILVFHDQGVTAHAVEERFAVPVALGRQFVMVIAIVPLHAQRQVLDPEIVGGHAADLENAVGRQLDVLARPGQGHLRDAVGEHLDAVRVRFADRFARLRGVRQPVPAVLVQDKLEAEGARRTGDSFALDDGLSLAAKIHLQPPVLHGPGGVIVQGDLGPGITLHVGQVDDAVRLLLPFEIGPVFVRHLAIGIDLDVVADRLVIG